MNFAGSIVDNFIMLRFLHPQELIFGRSTLQKRTSWLPKLVTVINVPVQSWFRNSEVLCKIIASHTVHCHDAEAAILKNLQWKAGKGIEVNRVEWEFTNGTAIFRLFGWNGKRGIRLKISIFFGNFPVEWVLFIWISNRKFGLLLAIGKRPRQKRNKLKGLVLCSCFPSCCSLSYQLMT